MKILFIIIFLAVNIFCISTFLWSVCKRRLYNDIFFLMLSLSASNIVINTLFLNFVDNVSIVQYIVFLISIIVGVLALYRISVDFIVKTRNCSETITMNSLNISNKAKRIYGGIYFISVIISSVLYAL